MSITPFNQSIDQSINYSINQSGFVQDSGELGLGARGTDLWGSGARGRGSDVVDKLRGVEVLMSFMGKVSLGSYSPQARTHTYARIYFKIILCIHVLLYEFMFVHQCISAFMQLYIYAFMIYATSHFSIIYPCIGACFDLAIPVEIHLSIYCCSHAVFMCVGIVVVCGNVCGCLGCVGEFWWAPGVVGG